MCYITLGSPRLTTVDCMGVCYRAHKLDPQDHLAAFHVALQLAILRQVHTFILFVFGWLHWDGYLYLVFLQLAIFRQVHTFILFFSSWLYSGTHLYLVCLRLAILSTHLYLVCLQQAILKTDSYLCLSSAGYTQAGSHLYLVCLQLAIRRQVHTFILSLFGWLHSTGLHLCFVFL